MTNYIIRKLLNDESLSEINYILQRLNWIDGLVSFAQSDHKIKNNLESSDPRINNIIMSALDSDKSFFDFVVPKRSGSCILSKMQENCYYNTHHDNPSNGNFSTTVFLNDPKEYDGGELCFLIDNKELKFKLNAGDAITYKTGIPHRVNKIIRGERNVAVFWTKSYINDEFMREIYHDISKVKNLLRKDDYKENCDYSENLEECMNSPYFIMNNITSSILRKYI